MTTNDSTPMHTVKPEKTKARPAWAIASTTAAWFSGPAERSLHARPWPHFCSRTPRWRWAVPA